MLHPSPDYISNPTSPNAQKMAAPEMPLHGHSGLASFKRLISQNGDTPEDIFNITITLIIRNPNKAKGYHLFWEAAPPPPYGFGVEGLLL